MTTTQASNASNRVSEPRPSEAAPPRNEPPRKQAERRQLGDTFASKLNQVAGQENREGGSATVTTGRTGQADRRTGSFGEERKEFSDDAEMAVAEMLRQISGGDRQASVLESSRAEAFDRALFDRIAARIAEARPGDAGSQVRIDLPAGQLAETVHLLREADGSLAIRVSGTDPRMSAGAQGMARQALEAALLRRKLRISSIAFEKATAGSDHRNASSDKSRVV